MSWARDEWKLDLPTTALKKISELENDAENLRKNKQQQQFQLESVSSALQKQKQTIADEKNMNANLRREIQELTRNFSELESENEKMQVDLKAKDNKIALLEDQLQKVRTNLKEKEEKNAELIKKLDEQFFHAEGKDNDTENLRKEMERLKYAREKVDKELETAKEKVENLCKEIDALKDQLQQRDDLLTEHSIEEENASIVDTSDPNSVPSVGAAFLEILKRENNALISDNEELKAQIEQTKNVLREKEKEMERVMEKLASSHAEKEKVFNELKTKEREIVKLEKKLHDHEKLDRLGKTTQLSEGIDVKRKDAEKAEKLSNELERSLNKLKNLETELTQCTYEIKAKQDRIDALEEESVRITEELASQKRQKNCAMDSYLELTTSMKEKEQKIKEMEEENKELKNQLKVQGEKNEIIGSENSCLKEELGRAEERFTNTEQSYRLVSAALNESRKAMMKYNLVNGGETLGEVETVEKLEKRKKSSVGVKSSDTNSKCRNCDQLKARIHDQQEVYSQKIRELEKCIRDLRAEKGALERKVVGQRRSSEDFADHVRQIVQRLEAERAHNERGEMEEKMREKENFFNMVKSFFAEQETMKYHVQVCLQDLTQVQQCFQNCSEGAKEVISHADSFENVAHRMSLLKSLLQSVLDEFARPLNGEDREPIAERDDSPPEPCIKAQMSWDNYEREEAFRAFKGDVDDILQQLERDKKMAEKKADEQHELRRARLALKQVRKRSRQEIESVLSQEDDMKALQEVDPRQSAHTGSKERTRMDMEYLIDVIRDLISQNLEEQEMKMGENFKRLENTIISQRCQLVPAMDNRKQPGAENFKDVTDGRFAIGELEIVRRKVLDVQKSIKHLVGSLAETDKEKKSVESKIDSLNGELCRKESLYREKCEDMKRVAKTASENEVTLRSRIEGLTIEKDELNSELRRTVAVLKKKEVELVEKCQELKHVEAACKDEKRGLQNRLTSLEQENDGLWLECKEADKRAEIKDREFKELVDRLKASQGYLNTMFNSLSSMDDELQRARDIRKHSGHN